MKRSPLLLTAFSICLIVACSSNKSIELPGAPSSVKAVQDEIKGKKFKAEKAGTHSLLKEDKSIEWLEPKEEDKFSKDILTESTSLQLEFRNDTAVTVIYKDKTYDGTYAVDDKSGDDEKPGIKLRLSYVDEAFKFGDQPASTVTFTYVVEGISDNSLMLETPRGMNNRNIVVLMNKI